MKLQVVDLKRLDRRVRIFGGAAGPPDPSAVMLDQNRVKRRDQAARAASPRAPRLGSHLIDW